MQKWIVLILASMLSGCVMLRPTDPYQSIGYQPLDKPLDSKRKQVIQLPDGLLSLKHAIQIALTNNPTMSANAWEIKAAGARQEEVAAQRWPNLHAVGGYMHHLHNQRLVAKHEPDEAGAWSSDVLSANLVFSMPIFTGGRIANQIKASELLHKSATHQLARTRRELIFNVESIFYSILGQRQIIESLEFSGKTLEEHCKRAHHLITEQKAAKVDLLRSEVRLAKIEETLLREKNTLAIQRQLLANFMGITKEDISFTIEGVLSMPQKAPDVKCDIAQALLQRNDYLAARTNLEEQAKRVDATRARRWPIVSLVGSYGERWAEGEVTNPSGASESEDIGSVAVYVNIPLFEGGLVNATIRKQSAELAASQEKVRELKLRIQLEIQATAFNVTSNLKRAEVIEKVIKQARESLRIERDKYDMGMGSIVDVLDAQSSLLEAETSYARVMADYNISQAQYKLVTGDE